MSATHSHLDPITSRIGALVLAAILSACATGPSGSGGTDSAAASTTATPNRWEIDLSLPPSDHEPEFAAADAALHGADWMEAEALLEPLSSLPLGAEDAARLALLRARIAHVRGREQEALDRLVILEQSGLSAPLAYRVYDLHRLLLDLSGGYPQRGRLGVESMQLAPDSERAALKQDIWRDLQRSDADTLATLLEDTADPEWRGWLALALAARTPVATLPEALQQWRREHPDHSAADPLPGGLEYLLRSPQPPANVALLLPLSGRLAPAGRAVRDGYLASYFAAGTGPGRLLVLDSEHYPSAGDAYRDALAQGAQLVVGPLRREMVGELALEESLPVPVLALNRSDLSSLSPGTLLQLSLAPEDEVTRLAERAFGDGARRAMILRPAGSWGDKLEQTLSRRWRELGGSVAASVTYTGAEEYSETVKAGLGIGASEQRRRRVRDMLATNIEFTPRRRQDLDAIFLLSQNPAEARALKPLLAFHYAGSLQVYAPPGVYGGSQDPRDQDLNGLRLVELPWLLEDGGKLQAQLTAAGSDQYPRLNALGADAFLLQSRLAQTRAGTSTLVRGHTGLLGLNQDQQVERELPMAEFDGGRIRPR